MSRAAKSNKDAKRRPLTGERRKCRKPLWIDGLSQDAKDAIIDARAKGVTWKETARAASAIAGRKIPRETARRWYDLRIEQPRSELSAISASLRASVDILNQILAAVKA